MVSGGRCVTMVGQSQTLKLCVGSLVTGNLTYLFSLTYDLNQIKSFKYGFNCGCMTFILHGRVGETLPSEGLDMNPVPRFGVGSGPILLDDVSCTGKEPSLLLCNRREWLRHDCTHHEDVNIACSSEQGADSPPASKKVFYLTVMHNLFLACKGAGKFSEQDRKVFWILAIVIRCCRL